MRPNEAETIVVGGGLAGLAAAVYLARAGRRVALYESGSLGGRAATADRNGFLFNEGPHALYCAGRGTEVLNELGIPFQGGKAGPDHNWALVRGKLHDLPRSVASLVTTTALSVGAKVEAGQVFARLTSLDPTSLNRVSLAEWLEREVRSSEVRDLVRALLRLSTYSNAPEVESFGADLEQFQLGGKAGVLYLDGGWQTLIEGLRAAALQSGVKIHEEVRVKAIQRSDAGYTVTRAEGETAETSQVLLAVRPAVAAALVPDSTALAGWAERALPIRAACLDLGLRRLPNPEVEFTLGLDEPLYMSVHTRAARLAPTGGAVVQVARYLGTEPPADPQAVERELEALMDLTQPGWREVVAERRYLPNMIVSNWVPTAATDGLKGRPGPSVPGFPGLAVAGDWVGQEGLLADAVLASARAAAHMLLGRTQEERETEYALG